MCPLQTERPGLRFVLETSVTRRWGLSQSPVLGQGRLAAAPSRMWRNPAGSSLETGVGRGRCRLPLHLRALPPCLSSVIGAQRNFVGLEFGVGADGLRP